MKFLCDRCKSESEPWTWVRRLQMMICVNCHFAVLVEDELSIKHKLIPEYLFHEKHEKI
jgi:hypothetical protein